MEFEYEDQDLPTLLENEDTRPCLKACGNPDFMLN